MIEGLHKRVENTESQIEPNEGERTLLCSNESVQRSPLLGFLDTSSDNVTEDEALDYLAQIIADIYLNQTYGNAPDEKSSIVLPGIDQRAG